MKNSRVRPSVVLVADRTLSARYRALFEGVFATMQTTKTPALLVKHMLAPPVRVDGEGRAHVAPLGLRRVEASLLRDCGLKPSEVVCTTPEYLPRLLGPWVKVVCFSSSDPLGCGMSNTTTTAFWGGQLYTELWSFELLSELSLAKVRYGFKVIAGGAGAWQFDVVPGAAEGLGIDVIFKGYFERRGPDLIKDVLEGRSAPARVTEDTTCVEEIAPIAGASLLGVVELSRGCGKGCRFCTMARLPMDHLPEELILSDIERNVFSGVRSVVSGSEDLFRYGAAGAHVKPERLLGLLERIAALDGLEFLQIDHANVSSVVQYSPGELKEIRRLLELRKHARYLWVNMGVESANGDLVRHNSPGKIAPFRPEDWEELVGEATEKLIESGFFPVLSVVLGLPGETADDVLRTRRLIERLGRKPLVAFPVFYEPLGTEVERFGRRFSLQSMTLEHFKLFTTCYELNFKYVPRLYWDNQRAAGVRLLKRLCIQALGRAEILKWRRNFALIGRKLSGGSGPEGLATKAVPQRESK